MILKKIDSRSMGLFEVDKERSTQRVLLCNCDEKLLKLTALLDTRNSKNSIFKEYYL